MPAAVVALANLGDPLSLPPEQRIYERGLADARHTDEDQGLARAEAGRETFEPRPLGAAQRNDGNAREGLAEARGDRTGVAVQVALVEDEQGPRAAVLDGRQVAPQAVLIHEPAFLLGVLAVAKRAHDADDVDVRGDHLELGAIGRRLTYEAGSPLQAAFDHERVQLARPHPDDPVPHARPIARRLPLREAPAYDHRLADARLRPRDVALAMSDRDARRNEAGIELRHLVREERTESDPFEAVSGFAQRGTLGSARRARRADSTMLVSAARTSGPASLGYAVRPKSRNSSIFDREV